MVETSVFLKNGQKWPLFSPKFWKTVSSCCLDTNEYVLVFETTNQHYWALAILLPHYIITFSNQHSRQRQLMNLSRIKPKRHEIVIFK